MRVWLILVFGGFVFPLFAQHFPFVLAPGSPPSPGDLFQDHSGRLWLMSDRGVQYFDGRFCFSLSQLGLPEKSITRTFGSSFAEDGDGGIWFVHGRGVYRFYESRLEHVLDGIAESVVKVAPDLLVASAAPFSQGDPVTLSLYRFQKSGRVWKSDKLADGVVRGEGRLTVDHTGKVLYPCPGAWCELSKGLIAAWHPGTRFSPVRHPDVYPGIETVLRDRFGCLWFRSTASAAYQCPGDSQPRQLPPEIASNGITVEESDDGSILLPSYLGLAVGRPNAFRIITAQNGWPLGTSALVGHDGTLWTGGAKGLYYCSYPFLLEYWSEVDGLAAPFSVLRLGRDTYASSGLGVVRLSPDRSRWLPLRASKELGVVRSLIQGPGRTILAVSHHNGVAQLALDGRILARSPPAADVEAMQLARSADGQFWLAGSGVGRIYFRGRRLGIIPEALPPPRTLGTDIEFERHTGKLWACYSGGLAVKTKNVWQTITVQDGLLENDCRSLVALPNGDVWFGYFASQGFAFVRTNASGKVTVQQCKNTSVDDARIAFFFDADSRGWLWRGTRIGVFAATEEEAKAGYWIRLDETNGLPSVDANQQSFLGDADGSVWWAAGNTIAHFFPPADFVHPIAAPEVFISGYSWNGVGVKLAKTIHTIAYGSQLVAHLGSLQFDRRAALRIRYRVLPGQPIWHEQRDLDLKLGSIHWGAHNLQVQACLLTGPWSDIQSQSFTVLKPYWLAWPFLFGVTGTLSVIGIGGYRWWQRWAGLNKVALPDLGELRLAALSPEAHDIVGTVLDFRYEAEFVLARGGFATVMKGRDLDLDGRPCAIKVFREDLKNKAWTVRQFQQEVAALERIRHPHVVKIYGHGSTPAGLPYLVMEFIEGRTLRYLLNEGPIPRECIGSLLRQLGGALSEIHARGILHRDVTPENLMIRSRGLLGDLVLIDFSIAIVKHPDEALHGVSRAAGTFYYMAPEQVMGAGLPASDIYSVAKVLVEMLAGSRLAELFPGDPLDLSARARKWLLALPFPLSLRSIDLIASALEYDPYRRPQSIEDLTEPIASELQSAAPV